METDRLYAAYLSCGGRVTTDSRKIAGGEMFFALKGENFDGNDYALSALEKGAGCVVVDRPGLEGEGIICVEDSLRALANLARRHRHTVAGGKLPVIGLTGTNGKTTTKNLIACVLRKKYRVSATAGNFNNDIGVPLTLLAIPEDCEIAVVEMGANHPDDIEKLVQVSCPDYGLITNVGKAHLLGFGSLEGVLEAKAALYSYLGSHRASLIFLNEDDSLLKRRAAREACHCFGYGLKYQGAEILPQSAENPFLSLKLDGAEIHTKLVGAYNAANVLAAIAVGDYFGVSRIDAIAAIEAFEPDNKRSQLVHTGRNTVIVDAYNANPTSMDAALRNFALTAGDGKLALLGQMGELGEASVEEHARVLSILRELGLDAVLVGEEFRKALAAEGIDPTGCGTTGSVLTEAPEFRWYPDSATLARALAGGRLSGRLILLKGSRSTEMEKVLPEL